MTKEQFKIAQTIRRQISEKEATQKKIRELADREGDHDFEALRQLAFDGCEYIIQALEKEFRAI